MKRVKIQLYLKSYAGGGPLFSLFFKPQNYVAEADAMIQLPYLHVEKQIQF